MDVHRLLRAGVWKTRPHRTVLVADKLGGNTMLVCLSVRQPWAWLIINGIKDIENRSFVCHKRGTIALHASGQHTKKEYAAAQSLINDRGLNITLPPIEELVTMAIVGLVDIVDCVTESASPWFTGEYGWVLANPRPGIPQPQKGQQGFFPVDYQFQEVPRPSIALPPRTPRITDDELKVGDVLQFPTGAIKEIVEIDPIKQEAIVVRDTGNRKSRYPLSVLYMSCDRVPKNVVCRPKEGQTSMKDWLNTTQERRSKNGA